MADSDKGRPVRRAAAASKKMNNNVDDLEYPHKASQPPVSGESTMSSSSEEENGPQSEGLKKDFGSIVWLLVLYTLQGIPMGMSGVFPLLLKEQGATYSELALFSMCSWPFSLKIFWAPIVDTVYVRAWGRRKTWLVPCQLLIAGVLYYLSRHYAAWLHDNDVTPLFMCFLILYFLAATQDIAVDGWAITMLSKQNVGYAGTTNSVGQTAGYFLSFSGFLALEKLGIVNLETFMAWMALIFLLCTILVAIFKKEDDIPPEDEPESLSYVYATIWHMCQMPCIQDVVSLLMVMTLPFGAADSAGLKLQERGVPKDVIALFATLSTPAYILLPWILSKYATSARPLAMMRAVYLPKVMLGAVSMLLVFICPTGALTRSKTHHAQPGDDEVSMLYYCLCFGLLIVHAALSQCIFLGKMSFFSQVSDTSIGGTYMTFLNTVSNIGGNLGQQLGLRALDYLAIRSPTSGEVVVDSFYVTCTLGIIFGVVWFKYYGRSLIKRIEGYSATDWLVHGSSSSNPDQKMTETPVVESKPCSSKVSPTTGKRICCVCKVETKAARDECIVMNGEDKCRQFILAHNQCLRAEGFEVEDK
ncbi:Major facilitator super domain-containing protein 3 [Perkinsus chesapeaki]|uniref:Major facilitator super domain-containing protein 3 n=1 Tax=Perkinsus chesapeaki TaxID=330153 RepID=A0A7J6MI01_PERCH|nr:Major facilitator super domain-containing protein 3 [Perkinsus chesapeaki]